jgi:hypothetical protein
MAYLTETDRIEGYREHYIRQQNGVGCKPADDCETCRLIRLANRTDKRASHYPVLAADLDQTDWKEDSDVS